MESQAITPWVGALLIGTGLVVTVTDLRLNKIYNVVTFPMIVVGLLLNALPADYGVAAGDWTVGAYGLVVGLGILFLPFALDLVKAGDVKYLAGVGALGGPWLAVFTFLYGSIVHGVICLVVLRKRGELNAALENIGYYFKNSFLALRAVDYSARSQGKVPYALGLFLGLLVALGCQWTMGNVFWAWA